MTEGKMGRPSTFSQETADRICMGIGEGKSLRTVLRDDGMPVMSTVFAWLREHEDFSKQYARATEERSEAMAEDIIEISDDNSKDAIEDETGRIIPNSARIQRARLQVDTRKWLMSKMKPKKYGEKVDVTSDGKVLPSPIITLPSKEAD